MIKARRPGSAEPMYLVQHDGKRDDFGLIGGRFEPRDADLLQTMTREIGEELGLEFGEDYTLRELIHEISVPARRSPTYGVLTAYHYRLYSVQMLKGVRLETADNRWVSKEELLAGWMDSGEQIAAWHAEMIDGLLPGGLDAVPFSMPEE